MSLPLLMSSSLPPNAVTIPADFPTVGVSFLRNADGSYTSSFNPDAYAATWGITKSIYVDVVNGNDSTGNGSSSTPYKTFTKAWVIAIAAVDTAIEIIGKTNGADILCFRDVFYPDSLGTSILSGKRVYLHTDNTNFKIYATTAQSTLTWTLSAGQTLTYQATRSSVKGVVDLSNKDQNGIPQHYSLQTSIANVEANAGSWFTDGTTVYVHTLAGTIPVNGTHLVNIDVQSFSLTLAASAELFIRNCFVTSTRAGVIFSVSCTDLSAVKVVVYNCAFANALPDGSGMNGFTLESIKQLQVYNSFAAYNGADGFNTHFSNVNNGGTPANARNYYSLFFNCQAYSNGLTNTGATNINNAFTSHEGACVMCIGCRGWQCQGPLFAFVNACYSILIGCKAIKSSNTGTGSTNAGFYFDNSAPNHATGLTAKVNMQDCLGLSSTNDLSSDGTYFPITLKDSAFATIYSGFNFVGII